MRFEQKLKLSENKEAWVKEINSSQYKAIVKSNYSLDDLSFIHHTNLVLEENLGKEIFSECTIIDKFIALLYLKAISVEPDLKLKIKCEESKKEFEATLSIDNVLTKINTSEFNLPQNIFLDGFSIVLSLPKAKDEHNFVAPTINENEVEKYFFYSIVSCINTITFKNETINFKQLSWEERCSIVNRLPAKLSSHIVNILVSKEKEFSENKIISVVSPYTNKVVLEMPLTTNVASLVKFSKLVYTENLTNLYTLTYNLISRGGFTGTYIDSITPIEAQIYWIYYQKQAEKESKQGNDETNPMRTNSEFT